MERSLTVVLPVQNAESTLGNTVRDMLDVLPDLTHRFDIVIVDDASTDGTREIAHDLARDYPQVRVACPSRAMGRTAAIRIALEQGCGDVVLLRDEDHGTPIDAIHHLWQSIGRLEDSIDPQPLSAGGHHSWLHRPARRPGFQVISGPASMAFGDGPEPRPVRAAPCEACVAKAPNYAARTKRFIPGP